GAMVANQPIGAPSWFPCNDHPADKARYRTSVTTAAPLTVLAHGQLVSYRAGAGTGTWVYEQPVPTPTYLATVQIGRYQRLRTRAGDVPVLAAVPRALIGDYHLDFARQPQMLAAFTHFFGPYPFPDYSVVVVDEELEVPIEAQGLSVFGRNHLDGRRGHERLIAHELAHQWFGNSVTPGDWRDIWLNEGFASYAEWLWSEASGGPPAGHHALRWHARLAAQPQDLVLADPGVRRMFDDRVYRRGALTLHALRTVLGDVAFFSLLRAWTAEYRHGSAGTADFVGLAQRHTPVPLGELFGSWLHSARLPALPTPGESR
ncbi:MAG TPA: M1 family metallopeptidase, partial [Pilimelia sp.]|nr:M1 family metallopeptidase [Pilimelia sp.]